MAFTAFQRNAFQDNAFQIDALAPVGGGYVYPYQRYKQKKAKEDYEKLKLEEQRAELERVEQELAEAKEGQKQLRVDTRKEKKAELQAAIAASEAYQQEIDRLSQERALLMRMIDDEEAIFVLMSSNPFH